MVREFFKALGVVAVTNTAKYLRQIRTEKKLKWI